MNEIDLMPYVKDNLGRHKNHELWKTTDVTFYKKNGYIIINAKEEVFCLKINHKYHIIDWLWKLKNLDFVLQNSTFNVENILCSIKDEIIVICLKDMKSG